MEKTSTKTSHSKAAPKPAVLDPFKFKKEELDNFLQQFDAADPKLDMKAAKKARAQIKKKINEIKKVHTSNKKIILQYKRDVEAYSLDTFTKLTTNLTNRFEQLDKGIFAIENAAQARDNEITEQINALNNDLVGKIFTATTTEEIQAVQSEIGGLHLDPNTYDNRLGEAEAVRTQMTLKAAARANEIQNAGGELSQVDPLTLGNNSEQNTASKYGDSELLNFLQKNRHPGKGWTVNVSPTTGVQVYQVDDPKAPRDIREALTEALDNYASI